MTRPSAQHDAPPEGAPYQIFLTEDHPVMREAYESVLAREDDLEVCGSVPTAEEALAFLDTHPCDLVITDVSLPGMDGLELARRLRTHRPDLRIVVISAHMDLGFAERARAVGAHAFLRKDRLTLTLVETLREVLHGGTRFDASPAHPDA